MENLIELKLANVVNNLDIFSKLIGRKYLNNDITSTINEIVEDLIFNFSKDYIIKTSGIKEDVLKENITIFVDCQ